VNDAGLFAGTLRRMLDAPLGFDPGHLLTFRVGVAETLAPGDADVVRMLEEAIRNTRAVPGVEQVAVANAVPLSNRWASTAFEPEGTAPPVDGRAPRALLQSISDGYLEALRIPLRQGRAFGSADGRSSLDVALISEPLARKYFPGGDALGARIRIGTRWRTVVGVVGAVKHTEIADPGVAIYLPLAQAPVREVAFAVRTAGAPLSAASAIREAVHAALPDQPISDLAPMRTVVDDNALLAARYAAGMLGVLGAIALMLSAVGIYGVVAQWVVQRLRELGIRSALGARRQLMGLVVSRSLRPAAVGLVLGLGLSLAHGRALRAALYGVSPNDPLTLTTVALFLGLVATAACLIPAGRALGQDPAAILRHE